MTPAQNDGAWEFIPIARLKYSVIARSEATKQSSHFDKLKVPSLSRDWIAIILRQDYGRQAGALRAPRDDKSAKGKGFWY